jgi:hypothetical protein
MNSTPATWFSITNRKAAFFITLFALAFAVLNLTQDVLRSGLNNTAYYFSESFMFSSFWWIFAPLLFAQYLAARQHIKRPFYFHIALILLPIAVHLIVFPLLVWAISGIFYYHSFAFQQTLSYTISEYLYLLLLLYSIPVLVFMLLKKRAYAVAAPETKNETIPVSFINTILVTDGYKKQCIAVSEILFFSANPPYINIYLEGKKYLHHETLKSVMLKLDPEQFTRVHKSTIVHIKMVDTITSRLNGDYDITLKNHVKIRVSRNYAAAFKDLFNKTHQLAIK